MGDWRVSVIRPRKGRDNGEWVLRVRGDECPQGRREKTGIPCRSSKRQFAEQLAARREAELNGGSAHLTVGEVYERWLASSSVKRSTKLTRVTTLGRLNKLKLKHAMDGNLSPKDVTQARRELTKGIGLKVSAGRLSLGHVKSAWLWARIEGLVEQDWPQLPRWKSPREERCKKRAFTDPELESLVRHVEGYAGGRYALFLQVLICTACRISEAISLDVSDVEIHEDHAALSIRETKTHKPRKALIPRWLGEALAKEAEGPWLFSGALTGKRLTPHSFSAVVRGWVAKHGHAGELDVHSIRRWGVGVLHRSGVPIAVAQLVTGHEDPSVFMTYAGRADYETLSAAQKLWGSGLTSEKYPEWTQPGPQDLNPEGNGPLGGISKPG